GTVRTGLYQDAFGETNVEVISPDKRDQDVVMESIYMEIKPRINLSKAKNQLIRVAGKLIDRGIEMIIIGCTDICLVVKDTDLPVPIVDSLEVLAEKIVSMASKEGSDVCKQGYI
ncbi:unnamed protein product, partial [marine sediment metagenome]